MAREKKERKSHLDDTTPRKSFYRSFADGIAEQPPGVQRLIWVALSVTVLAAIVCAFAFGIHEVTTDDGELLDPAPQEQPADDGAGSAQDGGDDGLLSAEGRFFGISDWAFLSSSETVERLENEIFTKLVELGLPEDGFVYVVGDWEQTDAGYVGWVKTSPDDVYYRVDIEAPGFAPTVSKAELSSIPGIEAEVSEANDVVTGRDNHDEEPADKVSNLRDLASAVALSDEARLAQILPGTAAAYAETVLIEGVTSAYGFPAEAQLSKVFPESVEQTATGCVFVAVFVDANQNQMYLEIEYVEATGNYSGRKIDA